MNDNLAPITYTSSIYIAHALLLDFAFSPLSSLQPTTTTMKSIFVSVALAAAADALIARDSTW
jgi:hypothetical protein